MTRFSFSSTWTLLNAVLALWILFSLSQADAAVLRPSVSVTGDTVTLGDLFDDAGDASDIAVAVAPRPGAPTAISVSRISQVARRNGVVWRNSRGLTRVVVSRTGTPIAPDMVRAELADAIAAQAPAIAAKGILEVVLSSGAERLMVTGEEIPSIAVDRLSFDRRTGRFQAAVRVPADDMSAPVQRVAGHAFPALDIPVLNSRMSPGDTIRETDVEWVRVPATRVSQNILDDDAGLIGYTPRRSLRPGEPIRTSDVEPPRLVEKGSIVNVTYAVANMTLSTRARALEDGALGDIIKVLNQRSHRTIEVQITGTNEAFALPPGPMQVSAAN